MQKLNDDWHISSESSNEDFFDEINKLTKRTKFLQFDSTKLEVLSFVETPEGADDNYLYYYVCNKESVANQKEVEWKVNLKKYPKTILKYYEDDFRKTGIIIRKDTYWFGISKRVLEDIIPVNLNMVPKGYQRANLLMATLAEQPEDKRFIIREDKIDGKTIAKAFVAVGKRYIYEGQIDFFGEAELALEDYFGDEFEISRYEITNDLTELWFSSKKSYLKDFETGFCFTTSDTCASGYSIRSYILVDGVYNMVEEYSQGHSRIFFEKFFSILPQMRRNLQDFCNILDKKWDDTNDNLYENLINAFIKLNSAEQNGYAKRCINNCHELISTKASTIGQQIKKFMSLPNMMECTRTRLNRFENLCVNSINTLIKRGEL